MAVTSDTVQAILGRDYQSGRDLTFALNAAAMMMRQVVACASRKGKTLAAEDVDTLTGWLAAHFYQMSDPGYQSKSTLGASGSFRGQTTQGLKATLYGQSAVDLDPTGCVAAVAASARAQAVWLGKTEAQQLPYDQRM